MPTLLKFLTKFRSDQGYGWTETHYKLSSSDNPQLNTQLSSFIDNVCNARRELLGEGCNIVGARVSYPRAGALASYGLKFFQPGNGDKLSASQDDSLAIVFNDVTYTKSKVLHLRGFWDAVEANQAYHPELPEAAGWTDRLVAWKTTLISGNYGWPSKSPDISAKGVDVTYTVGVDLRVTFVLQAPGMPAGTVGTIQQVRFSKFNNSQSILNRQLLVHVDDATHLTTVQQIGAGPMKTKGRFNYRGPTFVGYNNTGSISLGERRMGKPLDRYPGRSKAKPLI